MVAATRQQQPPGATLYVDHANHLTPLTLCYHATASRHLTTGRSDVIPPSTSTEIDSAYCPRCLTFSDAASVASSGGVCESCKDCPVCFSPVSLSIDKNENGSWVCHYLCGHCRWSSRECGVTSNADKLLEYSSKEGMDEKEAEKQRKVVIAEASKELELCLQQNLEERNKQGDALFDSITKMWAQREKEEGRRKRMQVEKISTKGGVGTGDWSMDKLKQSLLEKKKELAGSFDPAGEDVTSMDTDAKSTPITLPTPQQMAAQMTLTNSTPQYRSELFPLPVAYRTRVSRRCRAELSAGRTGILIKPKLNPLEGDTSLRAGHGQWWKKDSSAVHVVPGVQLVRSGADPTGQAHGVLLRVKNPTLNMIRLRFSGPIEGDSPIVDSRELENILVDPFTETFVKGRLCALEVTASLGPTEFFVLDPADDPFLDIGKGREEDPSEVRDWSATSALSSLGEGNASQIRVIATQGDTAWVELALRNSSLGGDDSYYLAVPLALQIEVGNGSWEASLIKRRDIPAEEKDLVTMNLVTLLR